LLTEIVPGAFKRFHALQIPLSKSLAPSAMSYGTATHPTGAYLAGHGGDMEGESSPVPDGGPVKLKKALASLGTKNYKKYV
jgi:hypothetical protein